MANQMLHLTIDYTLADSTYGTLYITVLNKNSEVAGEVRYSIEANSGLLYGSIEGYWAWSESLYACAARVVHKEHDFLRDHFGQAPVEALCIRFAGISPYGRMDQPTEMCRITLDRRPSGSVRAIAEGEITRAIWPLPLEKSNANLPWQIIFLCQICDQSDTVDFEAIPQSAAFRQQPPEEDEAALRLDELPSGVEPWVRAFVSSFYPMAFQQDGRAVDRGAWNNLVHPLLAYHRTAAIATFTHSYK